MGESETSSVCWLLLVDLIQCNMRTLKQTQTNILHQINSYVTTAVGFGVVVVVATGSGRGMVL